MQIKVWAIPRASSKISLKQKYYDFSRCLLNGFICPQIWMSWVKTEAIVALYIMSLLLLRLSLNFNLGQRKWRHELHNQLQKLKLTKKSVYTIAFSIKKTLGYN